MYFKSVEDANIHHTNMAIKNEEFYLVYQPKYDTYTEEIKGCEALIRWKRQDGTDRHAGAIHRVVREEWTDHLTLKLVD